jgi:organic radical activating enzyme
MQSIIVNKDNPIIKIEPYNNSFIIHWLVGKKCNFNCSYCPDMWHDPKAKNKSLAELQKAWIRMTEINQTKKQKYDLSFLGGENTLNKDFLPFLIWLREAYNDILENVGMITNGTANINYYKECIKYCNWITFSTHSEFMNEEKFFSIVVETNELSKLTNCHIRVNIMDEPWHKERNLEYKKFLDYCKIDNYIHPVHDFNEGKFSLPVKTNRINLYDILKKRSVL